MNVLLVSYMNVLLQLKDTQFEPKSTDVSLFSVESINSLLVSVYYSCSGIPGETIFACSGNSMFRQLTGTWRIHMTPINLSKVCR